MVGIMLLPTDIHQRKKRGEAMTENKIIIPIWKKSNLTVEEAAAYCGIGSRKLREKRYKRKQNKRSPCQKNK